MPVSHPVTTGKSHLAQLMWQRVRQFTALARSLLKRMRQTKPEKTDCLMAVDLVIKQLCKVVTGWTAVINHSLSAGRQPSR